MLRKINVFNVKIRCCISCVVLCCGCGIERFQISIDLFRQIHIYVDINFFNLMHQYFSLHLDTCFDVSTSLMVPYIG